MKNILVSEVRADKDGKLVTRHVRADKGTAGSGKTLPSPSLPAAPERRKRRAFKPTPEQLASSRFGIGVNQPDPKNWGHHVIGEPHADLAAIPFTMEQKNRYAHNFYRFDASEVEYYSVMSVTRPFDAINLLHRGIRSADEARNFLEENGLKHLIGDHAAYTDELLRHRLNSNLGMVYMNDLIDAQADPVLAGEWVKMCAQKSILDEARFIRDEMLSGQVTTEDLKAVGVRNLSADIKAIAQYIIYSKHDGNPDFTLDTISEVMEDVTRDLASEKDAWKSSRPAWSNDEFSYTSKAPARLAVARVLGAEAAYLYRPSVEMHDHELKRMESAGTMDPDRLGKLTHFATKVNAYLYDEEDFSAMGELYDTGATFEEVNAFLQRAKADKSMTTAERLVAAKEGLHTAIVDGWL